MDNQEGELINKMIASKKDEQNNFEVKFELNINTVIEEIAGCQNIDTVI
jgi:hypothetical protein